jgi:hypothetical protein
LRPYQSEDLAYAQISFANSNLFDLIKYVSNWFCCAAAPIVCEDFLIDFIKLPCFASCCLAAALGVLRRFHLARYHAHFGLFGC